MCESRGSRWLLSRFRRLGSSSPDSMSACTPLVLRADWWRTTSRDPLHVYVAGVRDPVLKRTESGEVVDVPEASPTVRWTLSSGPYAGSHDLPVPEEYLHWLERELVSGAERRTK